MDINVIIAALALFFGLPTTALVWRIGYHKSEIRRLSHESKLRVEETEARIKMEMEAEQERIEAPILVKEREHRLEQDKLNKAQARKDAEDKARAKAEKAAREKKQAELEEEIEVAELARETKARTDAFSAHGHKLWKLVPSVHKVRGKNGYLTGELQTVYTWHCTCGLQAPKAFPSEEDALDSLQAHENVRMLYSDTDFAGGAI